MFCQACWFFGLREWSIFVDQVIHVTVGAIQSVRPRKLAGLWYSQLPNRCALTLMIDRVQNIVVDAVQTIPIFPLLLGMARRKMS
jgi:hypothetical protein